LGERVFYLDRALIPVSIQPETDPAKAIRRTASQNMRV
jgi:hypothetical protein